MQTFSCESLGSELIVSGLLLSSLKLVSCASVLGLFSRLVWPGVDGAKWIYSPVLEPIIALTESLSSTGLPRGLGDRTTSTGLSPFVTTIFGSRRSGVSLSLAAAVYLLVSTSGVSRPLLMANLRRSREGAGLIGSAFWFTNPRRDGGLLNIGLPIGLETLETGVILPLQLDTKLTAGLTAMATSPADLRGMLSFNLLRADVGPVRPVAIVSPSAISMSTSTDADSGPTTRGSKDALKHRKHMLSNTTFPYSPHPFWHILGPVMVEFPLRCSADILLDWIRKRNTTVNTYRKVGIWYNISCI